MSFVLNILKQVNTNIVSNTEYAINSNNNNNNNKVHNLKNICICSDRSAEILFNMPSELLLKIMESLAYSDWQNLSLVSRRWHQLTNNNLGLSLWRRLIRTIMPQAPYSITVRDRGGAFSKELDLKMHYIKFHELDAPLKIQTEEIKGSIKNSYEDKCLLDGRKVSKGVDVLIGETHLLEKTSLTLRKIKKVNVEAHIANSLSMVQEKVVHDTIEFVNNYFEIRKKKETIANNKRLKKYRKIK